MTSAPTTDRHELAEQRRRLIAAREKEATRLAAAERKAAAEVEQRRRALEEAEAVRRRIAGEESEAGTRFDRELAALEAQLERTAPAAIGEALARLTVARDRANSVRCVWLYMQPKAQANNHAQADRALGVIAGASAEARALVFAAPPPEDLQRALDTILARAVAAVAAIPTQAPTRGPQQPAAASNR